MESETDQFIGQLRAFGTGSLMLIIPKRNVDFSGLEADDYVKIWYKRLSKESDSNEQTKKKRATKKR